MAVYFDHRAQAPYPGQNTDLQWHKSYAVLSVATFSEASGGSVIQYQEEVFNEWHTSCRYTILVWSKYTLIQVHVSRKSVWNKLDWCKSPSFYFNITWFPTHDHMFQFCQGEAVPDSILRKSKLASVIAWHPNKKIMAMGWETGEVSIRNEHENELYEAALLHKSEITILHWTSNGSKLLTGDSVSKSYNKLQSKLFHTWRISYWKFSVAS